MRDLIRQERFELEVLDALNSAKLLSRIVFCGGTMLRLCHGLNRFSVDLDFWVAERVREKELFNGLQAVLSRSYEVTDGVMKFHTILFEIRSKAYPRRLKIEIRREEKRVGTERVIAYSPHSNLQVMVTAVRLDEMMRAKAEAFLSRREIRDLFDMEFLLKKGVSFEGIPPEKLRKILQEIEKLRERDYKTRLGPLLEPKDRAYYTKENFKLLREGIASVAPSGLPRTDQK